MLSFCCLENLLFQTTCTKNKIRFRVATRFIFLNYLINVALMFCQNAMYTPLKFSSTKSYAATILFTPNYASANSRRKQTFLHFSTSTTQCIVCRRLRIFASHFTRPRVHFPFLYDPTRICLRMRVMRIRYDD